MVENNRAIEKAVRAYRPEDKPEVLALIEKQWGESARESQEFLWDWKHYWDSRFTAINVAQVIERNGEILGYSGSIPAQVKMEDCLEDCTLVMDTVVDVDERGSGLKLLKAQLRARVIFGSTSTRVHALFARLSGRKPEETIIMEQIRRICLVDPSVRLVQKGVPGFLAKSVGFFWRLTKRWRFASPPLRPGLRFEKIDEFPAAVDSFCRDFSKDFKYMVIRNREFLNWRYVRCPVRYEKRLLWNNNEFSGYMVYRVCMVGGRKVLLLVELAATGQKEAMYRAMLSQLIRYALEERANEIQTWDNGCSSLAKVMSTFGFYSKRGKTPIVGRVPQDMRQKYHDFNLPGAAGKWFMSLGDCEFEFIFFKFDTMLGIEIAEAQ